jgi:serine-type D-Ala-D-Ala carboxypeptidase/endopeptidase
MKYFISFFLLLLSIITNGQSNTTLPDDVVKSIEKRIEQVVNPSIVIGIIDKDGIHYFNYGKKSANGPAADEHTIYEIGSITKVFTAILLAQVANDPALDMGVAYESLMNKTITLPLGMKETKITLDEEMKNNRAIGHFKGDEVRSRDTSGEVWSSVYDMMKFLAANIGISQTSLQSAMNKIQEMPHTNTGNAWGGPAWDISKGKNGNVIYHSGKTWGYGAFVGFVKETGKGVVVLTNSTKDIEDIGLHLLNPELNLRQENIQIPEAILETYVGTYEITSSFCIVITREGQQLFAQATGQSKFEMFAKTEKVFIPDFNAQVTFNTKGKKGAVESFTLLQNGKTSVWKRVK